MSHLQWWGRIGSVAACLAGFWLPVTGDATSVGAQEFKVGYVDLGKIFDSYERTKTSDRALEQKGKQKETELEGRMNELKKLRENLELLSQDARDAKTREVEEKTDDLQRLRTNTVRELRRERDTFAKDILKEIQQGIDDYAKANSFALILDGRSLLYGQTAYDVTDEVVKLLNSRLAARQEKAR